MEQQVLPPARAGAGFWPWIIILIVLAAGLAWRGMARSGVDDLDDSWKSHPAVGSQLPYFHLEPLTGDARPKELADLQGKVTLINLWGPWCGVCAVEFPHLVELEQHFRAEPDFQFLSVSTNYDPTNEVGLAQETEQFLKQYRAEFPTYRDPAAATQKALLQGPLRGELGYPATLLVDREAKIRGLWLGYYPGVERQIREAIAALLAGNESGPQPSDSQRSQHD